MKYGTVDVQIQAFLTAVQIAVEWSASRFGLKVHGIHWIGGWVGPRIDLDDVERRKILPLSGLESRPSTFQPVASRYNDCAILAPSSVRYVWYVAAYVRTAEEL
jgi:hypothetical protein